MDILPRLYYMWCKMIYVVARRAFALPTTLAPPKGSMCMGRANALLATISSCTTYKRGKIALWTKLRSYTPHKKATLILQYAYPPLSGSRFNTALRILGDEDIAQDAAQEAFISAFRSINTFRGGSFKAWLLRTVTNACYDELRRQKRRPTTPLEPETNDGEEMDSPALAG